MNLNRSGEDYLKAILILQKKNGEVHSSEVASCLNVTRPSTSKAVRLLKDGGFLTMDKSKKISLTDLGRQVAEEILEKHCVIRDVLILFGVDRWGKEYASYNKPLCERNAKAEGAANVSFVRGDAARLDFPDESFDAVVSNYVYHNIPGDRQALLLESLRVLKKGGVFAIHDIFSARKYGDMQAFVQRLKDRGYERVELIDTADGKFISKREAAWMALAGSALLTGRK